MMIVGAGMRPSSGCCPQPQSGRFALFRSLNQVTQGDDGARELPPPFQSSSVEYPGLVSGGC
jgi:hypothetical protein